MPKMEVATTRPTLPFAGQFPRQEVTIKPNPARKIKSYTTEASICMKTKGPMTIRPEKCGHFGTIEPQLGDILATTNARMRTNLTIWSRARHHERAKNIARQAAKAQSLINFAPDDDAHAGNTPITGYPGKLLKTRERRSNDVALLHAVSCQGAPPNRGVHGVRCRRVIYPLRFPYVSGKVVSTLREVRTRR
jgi:hypothetical protein